MSDRTDVVVVGAGVAGLAAAALLARDHGMAVTVLERAPFIGGRAVSFVGRGNKLVADGAEYGPREFRRALAHARTFVGPTTPGLETIFEQGLLDGWTVEAGAHGLFWGDRSRVRCLLEYLDVPVPMPVNSGLGFVDYKGGNQMYQVPAGARYPWMSDEGYTATLTALRDMATVTPGELGALMNTPLSEWLAERDLHPEAYDYIKVLAASQTAMADPAMTPTGDFLGYMMTARPIQMNLVTGSVATVAGEGPIALPEALAGVVEEHEGRIVRSATVTSVEVDQGRVTAVDYRHDGKEHRLAADRVICTIPPKYAFSVLPREPFPSDWVETLTRRFWGAGLLSGFYGVDRNVWDETGVDIRSFVYMPDVMSEGYVGAVDMVMASLGSWGARAPQGFHDFIFSTALIDREMRDPELVRRVTDFCDRWFDQTFGPEGVLFRIWTPSPEAYGLWRPVGVERPDVASPWVDGLFFAGDQYGRRLWGGGVDGAALSAVMCADAIAGTDREREVFPWYHQGVPEDSLVA